MSTDFRVNNPNNTLYQLNYLACIEVTGNDASQFLQGQLTCNINDLSDSKASIAAFCNPKGRVISTLIILKTQEGFLLVLPLSLQDKVLKKLQMYVLRSKVQLSGKDRTVSVTGLGNPDFGDALSLPTLDFHCTQGDTLIAIKLPSSNPRFLCISNVLTHSVNVLDSFEKGDCKLWRYQDISHGFPWFDANQSEKYIPQMLNIDQLGGISYNKGCYTGQEIIARTRYLGKAKRHLCLLECEGNLQPEKGRDLSAINSKTREKVGEIIELQALDGVTRMLAVLQTGDEGSKNLILDDRERTPIVLIPFQ
ncbi:CAF17-like 4Fe-4S cluster assembly/insertion protein YgfZ [Methylomonas sp. MgM2]